MRSSIRTSFQQESCFKRLKSLLCLYQHNKWVSQDYTNYCFYTSKRYLMNGHSHKKKPVPTTTPMIAPVLHFPTTITPHIKHAHKITQVSQKLMDVQYLLEPGDTQSIHQHAIETEQIMKRYSNIVPMSFITHRPPPLDGKILGRIIFILLCCGLSIHILPETRFHLYARDCITLTLRIAGLSLLVQSGVHMGLTASRYGHLFGRIPSITRNIKLRETMAMVTGFLSLIILTFSDTWVRDSCYLTVCCMTLLTGLDYFIHTQQLSPPWYIKSMVLFRLALLCTMLLAILSEQFQLNEKPIQFQPESLNIQKNKMFLK